MDDVSKYGKTLEEIEGELMFGEIPDDASDDSNSNIFDEYDAANEETFGAELDDVVDAELEDYAAQTARLRLDDPVWENPTVSAAAPDASQIPMPYNIFGGPDTFSAAQLGNVFGGAAANMSKSIWGSTPSDSLGLYNIWSSDLGGLDTQTNMNAGLSFGDFSTFIHSEPVSEPKVSSTAKQGIPAMPSLAMTLEDLEKCHISAPSSGVEFEHAPLSELQDRDEAPTPTPLPEFKLAPVRTDSSKFPLLPTTALSIEELERQLIQESRPHTSASISKPLKPTPPKPIGGERQRGESISSEATIASPKDIHVHTSVPLSVQQQSKHSPKDVMPVAFPHQQMSVPPQVITQNMMPIPQPQMSIGGLGAHQQIPPMQLPVIPPLPPQFLQFVPAWLFHITRQQPMPMGVPPPPPFLLQLLHAFKDPQLVQMIIMRSSVPPMISPAQQMMSGPSSPMCMTPSTLNRTMQRKPPGMPSCRTIHDLAFDSFAGYMSWKEREWLVRIQLLQCQGCGDPQIEDYYYLTWREKRVSAGWTPTKNDAQTKEKENELDYMERTRRMNYREMLKERSAIRKKERDRERAENGDEKKPRQPLSVKFATSLGLPSRSTTANPRHLIDMKSQMDSDGNPLAGQKLSDEERKHNVAKKLRTMLIRLEGAMTMLIEIDEMRRSQLGVQSRFKEMTPEEKTAQCEKRVTVICNELMGDDLHKVLQMGKGRSVLTRTLRVAGPKEQARIILALMSAGGLVNKKYYIEIGFDILPIVHKCLSTLHRDQFSVVVGALNLDQLKKQLADENLFIRDILLTIFMVSVNNGQNLLSWVRGTRFPSLALSGSHSLDNWRRSLCAVNDAEMKRFGSVIGCSGIKEAELLESLIQQSI